MKRTLILLALVAAVAAGWYFLVYEKPGPVEQFGRELDETVDKIRYGDETTLEKASRKTRETVEEVKKELEK